MENYNFIKHLGEGSCGSVGLYTCLTTGSSFAIKKIENISQNRKMIDREKKILEDMKNCPNVVSLKHSFSEGKYFFIVMEHCEGGSLEEYLMKRPAMPKRQKLSIIVDILRGLKSIHKKNCIHRDLKLSNCLVKDGIVKLADFGISRHYIRNAEMTACGTPLNVAPEVFKTNKYTSKIDIWSFGVVCYEMLKGKHPFNASNFEDLQEMHQNDLDYSSLTQDEVNFLKLALNPLPAHRSDVEGLIKSKLISEYLSKIFTDISELYLRISTENSKLSQKVRLSLCLYILTEVLFTKDKSQFKLELNDLKNSLNISTLSSKTQENLLKSLLKYSEQLNEKSPSSSSLLVYIHRRLSALPNIENFN